jgi:hypothetical protein
MTKRMALLSFEERILYLLKYVKVNYTDLPVMTEPERNRCRFLGATPVEIDKAALNAFEAHIAAGHGRG